ncbi:PAS domain-containing sensor histidine kinase [Marinifilum sp. D737]|uniref:PAS domain-containing sensor histidine kinase n=1 Tax=Marinifilum sp. D737 TaxID=2969628 RepID=UPI002275D85E|nr:PAS domain S-box protein [Marinifilum sp. D737]MCY1634382.1 PAS domain S-box protein [Marinifilum sp. D737]
MSEVVNCKISSSILNKWQDVMNLISTTFNISNVIIAHFKESNTQLLLKSDTCDKALILEIQEYLDHEKVLAVKNEICSDDLALNNYNNLFFWGYPLKFSNGDLFGVLYVVNEEEIKFDSGIKCSLVEFRKIIESDLKAMYQEEMNKFFLEEYKIENQKLVEQLLKSELKYKTLFSASNSAIAILEPIRNEVGELVDLLCKDMNPANEEIIEISKDKAIGKTLLELFPNTEPEWIDYFNSVTNDFKNTNFYSYHSDIGKFIYVDSFPLSDKEFAVSAVDLTDKVKLKEKLSEAENRYKNIFYGSSSVMMLVSPENGLIKDVNESACEFYGYSKRELLNLKIWDLNIAGEVTVWDNIEKAKTNSKTIFKAKHRIASGEIKDVEISSGVVMVDGIELLHSVIRDVTERNINLLKLTKLSNAVEQSPASIVITNTKGEIEYVNPIFCKLTGYGLEELIGENPRILKSGKQSAIVYKDLWQTISSGEKWKGEFYNKRKDSSYYWESASISPVVDDENSIIGYLKVGLDITEKKQIEAKLTHALLKAEENDRLKTAFLANLSHEVRTPLNGLLGFTDFIGDVNLTDEERKQYASIIKDCGNQLMSIMNDIMDASLLEAKKLQINVDPVSLDPFLLGLKNLHTVEAEKKKLSVKLDYMFNPNFEIHTDKGKLLQVLNNLIRNAIKFTKEGEIVIGCESLKDSVLFYVQDTGIGISPEHQRIIFSRFRQIENHLTRQHGGIGLGLSISKDIVELLGGELWVESAVERGSKFSFTIPKSINLSSI